MPAVEPLVAALERAALDVPVAALPPLLGRLAALQGLLAGRLVAGAAPPGKEGARGPGGPEEDRLLSVPEAAKLLNFAPSYVYELARRGVLPAVRHGKYVRVRQGALREFMERNETKGLSKELYVTYNKPR